ncbi:MAG: protein rep, partial [Acaryochloridaceae cyanobacterium CSU_3_4]|nr:protein rep [Acaryochloridaceae cyanobacterium CSU_3_4]
MPNSKGSDIYLRDLSERDKPWDVRRATTDRVQALYSGTEYDKYSERMYWCSRVLEFGLQTQSGGEQRLKLTAAKFCRVRHCPVCQWRKTLKWLHRALKGIPKIREDYPKARWLFLTLTVKNVPLINLRVTVKDMNKAFDRLSKRKEWKPVLGWARSLEITRSEIGEAHPHFHILMMVKPSYFGNGYVKTSEWAEVWKSCLRVDYLPIVNTKAVKPKSNDGKTIEDAIRETFKYAVKPSDLVVDREWLVLLTDQLSNSRSINIGGVLRQYWKADEAKEDEDLIRFADDESEDNELEDDIRLYFGW